MGYRLFARVSPGGGSVYEEIDATVLVYRKLSMYKLRRDKINFMFIFHKVNAPPSRSLSLLMIGLEVRSLHPFIFLIIKLRTHFSVPVATDCCHLFALHYCSENSSKI